YRMKIGLAGIGRMGAAMATRLMGCAHEVSVWNRTPEKIQALVRQAHVRRSRRLRSPRAGVLR
ncbi:MAG: NAD(P)-binding domain-containing protein, partial [Betaproteobacteria bacterium]